MVELHELSKIGFGAYRVSNNEHANALKYAIECGCNLIDTASGYMNGESENLIGKVLDEGSNKDVFIITKAGYISNNNLTILQKLNKKGKGLSDLVNVTEDFKHSIHPEYLDAQIKISLKRLKRKSIDGFLLHSPEYYFEQKDGPNSKEEYYNRIKKAFEFLEDEVKKKTIRYYGISSNTLPSIQNEQNATDLKTLIDIASQISSTNNFKLIQFPFNIIERNASVASNKNEKSLMDIAKENKILTFANRPLNANTSDGLLRLAIYNYEKEDMNINKDTQLLDGCLNIIETQLKEFDSGCKISDISILSLLKQNWMNITSPDAFGKIFHGQFYPFLNLIFDNNIPGDALKVFKRFENSAWNYHLKALSEKAINYLKSNNLGYLLDNSPPQSLSNNLCNEYLKNGIDHVLVGMRKLNYVNELKGIF